MLNSLGRLFGLSFRTERLIMNLLGLVNSTLDWSSIKWANKLEQIWNLSLSQGTLILDVVGEDTIKTILSWIVITRIVIAHVYTISYAANIYPILTWSRPNLLLPWLILSIFKDIVLEVIVIAVSLLFWYDKRFSLPIFLEFVVVKVVPLLFASYNWYSNSCLFWELHRAEKLRKLKRSLKSDSNLMVTRLCMKMADSKYRTRSLMTLISCESYESSYESNDTISRVIDDPQLTPAQKTMRILGLTEQDVQDARTRIKERELYRKLTEEKDELFYMNAIDTSRYFSFAKTDLDVTHTSRYFSFAKTELDVTQTWSTDEDKVSERKDTEGEITEEEKQEIPVDEATEDEVSRNEIPKDDIPNSQTTDEIAINDTTSNEDNNPSSVGAISNVFIGFSK
ncbi:uncharacterized protein LOC143429270 [Xylocopa sonorina]|uniref:uncharacterized protein LOC143429270 n=1 Tax=Xylocopa sonorina TaxID=1818115 RepID=UPI00403AB1C5